MNRIDRRQFLRLAVAAGGACGLSALPRSAAAAADTTGYRALVAVFLLGGNDSFNLIVPRSDPEYAVYAASRQNLAIPQGSLLPITPATPDGATYGLHPSVPQLQQLFGDGRAAIVAGVGPLVEPATKGEVLDRSVLLPPQLFSHNDQQDQWQTLKGRDTLVTGWAGRTADILDADLAAQQLPMNISIAGTVPFHAASSAEPYVIGEGGVVGYAGLDPAVFNGVLRRQAFEAVLAGAQPTIYGRALNRVHERALALADRAQSALAQAPPLTTVFPDSALGRQLVMVARVIAVRDLLAMRRQIFLVAIGGFDTHDVQNTAQPGLLGGVSAALAAFDAAMTELGVGSDVTAFTMSDFGRTLTSNGDGTDHGWAGHQIVVGGAVRGGDIYGTMPRLEIDGPDDVGGGRIVPTASVHQYAATLLRWYGLDESQIDLAVPGLDAFPVRDLGFIA
jgi:uncharacterized protein (DUF1501 family)